MLDNQFIFYNVVFGCVSDKTAKKINFNNGNKCVIRQICD